MKKSYLELGYLDLAEEVEKTIRINETAKQNISDNFLSDIPKPNQLILILIIYIDGMYSNAVKVAPRTPAAIAQARG